MATTAVRVSVSGRVQGVSFRAGCRRRARELGVAGWVRNAADGSVLGQFEGESSAVEALVAWCRSGPPGARVTDAVVQQCDSTGVRGFHVEP